MAAKGFLAGDVAGWTGWSLSSILSVKVGPIEIKRRVGNCLYFLFPSFSPLFCKFVIFEIWIRPVNLLEPPSKPLRPPLSAW